jgi:hypothetical protein
LTSRERGRSLESARTFAEGSRRDGDQRGAEQDAEREDRSSAQAPRITDVAGGERLGARSGDGVATRVSQS